MEFDPHILNAKEIPIEYFEASTQIINEIMSQRPQKTVLDQNAEFLLKSGLDESKSGRSKDTESDNDLFENLEERSFNFVDKSNKKLYEFKENEFNFVNNSNFQSPKLHHEQSKSDFYHLLDHAIKDARQKLTGLRNKAQKLYDKENAEVIQKAKKNYSNHLKESVKEEKIRQFKNLNNYVKNQHRFLTKYKEKTENHPTDTKDKIHDLESLNYEIQKKQKADYLRKIKKLVFQMEKRKILQEEKEGLEQKQIRTQEATLKFESIKNSYDDKIMMLQEKLRCMKIERNISEKAEKQAIRELQKDFQMEKMHKIETLENFLKQANESLN